MIRTLPAMTIEQRLALPDKTEEQVLFGRFDLGELLDRYDPLVHFLIDDYICANSNTGIIVEELLHNALLKALMRFRSQNRHLGTLSFTFYYTMLARDIMNNLIKEGGIYRLSDTKITSATH